MKWSEANEAQRAEARRRRHEAARRYQPPRIRLLLIAAAPPEELDRYFYFENARDDPLFEPVCYVLFEEKPGGDPVAFLKGLRRRGVFLTHLSPDEPIADRRHREQVGWLPMRVETLAPEHVMLIGAPVYDAARAELKAAQLPLVERRIPGPDGGHEADFVREFRAALVAAGLERLIRPLPRTRA